MNENKTDDAREDEIRPVYFMSYLDNMNAILRMNYEQIGMLYAALFRYVNNGELPGYDDPLVLMMFDMLSRQIERDYQRYASKVRAGRKSAKLRSDKKKQEAADDVPDVTEANTAPAKSNRTPTQLNKRTQEKEKSKEKQDEEEKEHEKDHEYQKEQEEQKQKLAEHNQMLRELSKNSNSPYLREIMKKNRLEEENPNNLRPAADGTVLRPAPAAAEPSVRRIMRTSDRSLDHQEEALRG